MLAVDEKKKNLLAAFTDAGLFLRETCEERSRLLTVRILLSSRERHRAKCSYLWINFWLVTETRRVLKLLLECRKLLIQGWIA